MSERTFRDMLVDDLFFEQESEVLGSLYRHGVLRTLFVLGRSLFRRSRGAVDDGSGDITAGSTVAVVFFKNELNAALHARHGIPIDRVLHLDITRLTIVRRELGLAGLIKHALSFFRVAIPHKGLRSVPRSSIPLLGWLLYETFLAKLTRAPGVTVITTNMQHPASIGVQWAANRAGRASVFVEHATTPPLVVRPRGYGTFYVNFEHTRQMLVSKGALADAVRLMGTPVPGAPAPAARTRRAGICINDLDSAEAVALITDALLQKGIAVSYRMHEADLRIEQFRKRAADLGLEFSSARQSNIADFIATVDLVIAGNSNVIADSLLAGKPVLYYWSGHPDMFDYYGFVGYYRLPHARNQAELLQSLAANGFVLAC